MFTLEKMLKEKPKVALWVSRNVRHYRWEKKLSQQKLSELSGADFRTISQIEEGRQIHGSHADTLYCLARALDVSIDQLFTHRDYTGKPLEATPEDRKWILELTPDEIQMLHDIHNSILRWKIGQ